MVQSSHRVLCVVQYPPVGYIAWSLGDACAMLERPTIVGGHQHQCTLNNTRSRHDTVSIWSEFGQCERVSSRGGQARGEEACCPRRPGALDRSSWTLRRPACGAGTSWSHCLPNPLQCSPPW